MKCSFITACMFVLLGLSGAAFAAVVEGGDGATGPLVEHVPSAESYAHPTLPPVQTHWPAIVMMVVAGLFIAAAVMGPVTRMEMPEEEEPAAHQAHDGHGHH